MIGTEQPVTRRQFLQSLGGAFAAFILVAPRSLRAATDPPKHPDPRPGITSANVLPEDKILSSKSVLAAYAGARAHPEVFDGIACGCGCREKHRSLLTCYETRQPTGCMGCIEEAQIVAREIAAGKTLEEVRTAVNKWTG